MNLQGKLTLEDVGSFLAKLAEKSESVYWLSSPDFTKIQYISPSFEKIWQRSREELYKHPEKWITFLHPEDARDHHPIEAMRERVEKLGEAARYEENYRIIRPDGEVRWILDRGFPIIDENGKCCGVTGIAIDITEQKKYEAALLEAKKKAEEANKAKSQFIANMSHDLRTPLSGIVGLTTAILPQQKDEMTRNALIEMSKAGQRLLDLADEVLEISTLEEGEKYLYQQQNFKIHDLISKITDIINPAAIEKNIGIYTHYTDHVPEVIFGYNLLIHRCLLNLVSNALKFTHEGQIDISVDYNEQPSPQIIIKVKDTGIGIEESEHEKIFEKFQRLTASYQEHYRGSGLGLHLVKEFINHMEGAITVESEVGKGATFTCYFPVKAATGKAANELYESYSAASGQFNFIEDLVDEAVEKADAQAAENRPHILLVEDNHMAQMIGKTVIAQAQCQLTLAATSASALRAIQRTEFDLIIMDVGLPDRDGIYTTQQIRQIDSPNKNKPIVGLTAHVGRHAQQICLQAGMNLVWQKPLTPEKLLPALQQFHLITEQQPQKQTQSDITIDTHIIDPESTARLLNTSFEDTRSFYQTFAKDLVTDQKELTQAIDTEDWKAARFVLHRVQGSLAYCKAPQLSQVREKLHDAVRAKQPKLKTIKSLLEKFKKAANQVVREIEKLD